MSRLAGDCSPAPTNRGGVATCARNDSVELNNMPEFLVAFIFGFGLVFISLLLSVLGILKDKYWLVIIGAVLFLPFSYYLFGASGANGFSMLPLLLQMLSAAAVYEKYKLWAWIFLTPSFLMVLWVLVVALFYGSL
jgi:hypothetical protein